MGHAGAAGQDLREFTVLRTGFLAEEDGFDACFPPSVVKVTVVVLSFERIPRVCSAAVGGPGAVMGSLVCISFPSYIRIMYEGNDTTVVDAGTLPFAREGELFPGPRIRLGVVYQHRPA